MNDFKKIEKAVEASLVLLEEVTALDFASLDPDTRDFLLSQLKRTIGKLARIAQ